MIDREGATMRERVRDLLEYYRAFRDAHGRWRALRSTFYVATGL